MVKWDFLKCDVTKWKIRNGPQDNRLMSETQAEDCQHAFHQCVSRGRDFGVRGAPLSPGSVKR